jgi:hypothetical protein
MKPPTIKRVSVILLTLGLGTALVIFFTAQPERVDPLVGDLLSNKKYLHELRVMGGKSNVLAAELMDGFSHLWHGRELAGTIAALTVLATLVFRFVAARPDLWRDEPARVATPSVKP